MPDIWPYKKTVSRNHSGNSTPTKGRRVTVYGDGDAGYGHGKGSRQVITKRVPIQPEGFPSGKCLGHKAEAKVNGRTVLVCRCGNHNRSARAVRS